MRPSPTPVLYIVLLNQFVSNLGCCGELDPNFLPISELNSDFTLLRLYLHSKALKCGKTAQAQCYKDLTRRDHQEEWQIGKKALMKI